MPPLTIPPDELRLAWRRYKLDHLGRVFFVHSNLTEWIEVDLDGWLNSLRENLAVGFDPAPARLCFSPKSGDLLRPGTLLQPRDAVVYNLLVGRLLPGIGQEHAAPPDDHDYAYRLHDDLTTPKWLKDRFKGWRDFRVDSLERLEHSAFMVKADISGFYDNIDLSLLISDWRRVCGDTATVDVLRACLQKWATLRERGIPQGYSASDLLSKLYLRSVDQALFNAGFRHLRYVDDIRIFCGTRREAREALRRLIELLYNKGLTVQSAKTKVMSQAAAKPLIDGITPTIQRIRDELIEQIEAEFQEVGEYLSPRKVMILLGESEGPPVEVIERAFEEFFSAAAEEPFDTSLFHFLLARLGAAGSQAAIAYCIRLLRDRPEETEAIASYLEKVDVPREQTDELVVYMGSDDAIHDYQLYQLVRLFLGKHWEHPGLVSLCRRWAFDTNRGPWLRSPAIAYLGANGDQSDLEVLMEKYPSSSDQVERADIVAALSGLEKSRRNAFYARASLDGDLIARAVNLVKSQSQG